MNVTKLLWLRFGIFKSHKKRLGSCSSHRKWCSTLTEEKQTTEDDDITRLIKTVSPLVPYPYENQLLSKKQFCEVAARKLKNLMTISLGKNNQSPQFLAHMEKNQGLAFTPPDVIPSPVIDEYRNKDSPVIGLGTDGKPEIGFYARKLKGQKVRDLISGELKITKPLHYELMQAFREVVRRSGIPAHGTYYSETGHWKKLLIRSNSQGEIMMATDVFGMNSDLATKARDLTLEFVQNGAGRNFDIKSLSFQKDNRRICRDGDATYELLWGKPFIQETLCGRKFNISPNTFFQINTSAAEVMFDTVREMCSLNKNTVLLDVCCGTGTIGIIFGSHVRQVIGIEQVRQCVQNAIVNAEQNGIDNACFMAGTAEKYLTRILNNAELEQGQVDIVAMVNPGRAGLGETIIRALRNCEAIRKVLYISCKPAGRALLNFHWLCMPPNKPDPKITGSPFLPVDVRAVDMFPHTKHFELMLLFER